MLASPHLAALETFCTTGDSIEGLNEESFLEMINHGGELPPGLQNLRALSLTLWGDKCINDKGLAALIESDLGSTLTCLCLDWQDSITENGLALFTQSQLWSRLNELDLGLQRKIPDTFSKAWSHSQLKRLRVNTISDQFERLFFDANVWGELTHLDLDDTTITLDDFRRFVGHPSFTRLEELHLNDDRLSSEHIMSLANSFQAAGLKALHLRQWYDDDDALTALSESSVCHQLRELSLNNVTPDGMKEFVNSENFSHLHSLSIQCSELTACLDILATAKNLPKLTSVGAFPTFRDLGEASWVQLLRSPNMQQLSFIDLFQPQTDELLEALRKAEHIGCIGIQGYINDPELQTKLQWNRLWRGSTPPFFRWKPSI